MQSEKEIKKKINHMEQKAKHFFTQAELAKAEERMGDFLAWRERQAIFTGGISALKWALSEDKVPRIIKARS